MKLIVATLLTVTAISAAQAQTVFRCGNAYSQSACPEGKLVEVSDARSAAQQVEARRVVGDERRLAAEMRRDRLADERAVRPGGAASLSGYAPPKMAIVTPERHHKKRHANASTLPTTDFVAFDPSSRKRRND